MLRSSGPSGNASEAISAVTRTTTSGRTMKLTSALRLELEPEEDLVGGRDLDVELRRRHQHEHDRQQRPEGREGQSPAVPAEDDPQADPQETGHQQEVAEEADVLDVGRDPADEQQLGEQEGAAHEQQLNFVSSQRSDRRQRCPRIGQAGHRREASRQGPAPRRRRRTLDCPDESSCRTPDLRPVRGRGTDLRDRLGPAAGPRLRQHDPGGVGDPDRVLRRDGDRQRDRRTAGGPGPIAAPDVWPAGDRPRRGRPRDAGHLPAAPRGLSRGVRRAGGASRAHWRSSGSSSPSSPWGRPR